MKRTRPLLLSHHLDIGPNPDEPRTSTSTLSNPFASKKPWLGRETKDFLPLSLSFPHSLLSLFGGLGFVLCLVPQ